MSYIRFAPSSGSTDPFYHRRATCAPSSCRPSSSGPSFNPIADILSALESEFTGARPQTRQQAQAQQPKRPTTTPHFDVVEIEDAYILEGELPGVSDKRSIDIQFSDAQTLVLKGEIKKKSHDKKRQQRDVDDLVANEVSEFVADLQEQEEEQKVQDDKSASASASASSAESVRSLKTTVEEAIDESESGSENDFEVVDSPSTLYKGKNKAAPTSTTQAAEKPTTPTPSEPEKPIINQKDEKEEPSTKKPSPTTTLTTNHKYWISERSAGDFARSFTFQSLIDQDAVKATLEHGILEIVVPKRQPYVRRVQIQ